MSKHLRICVLASLLNPIFIIGYAYYLEAGGWWWMLALIGLFATPFIIVFRYMVYGLVAPGFNSRMGRYGFFPAWLTVLFPEVLSFILLSETIYSKPLQALLSSGILFGGFSLQFVLLGGRLLRRI